MISSAEVMDLLRDDPGPTSTAAPDSWKSVRTTGGMYVLTKTSFGWNAVAPANPPKNISPLGLWKQAPHPVKSSPGRASAPGPVWRLVRWGSNVDTPPQ